MSDCVAALPFSTSVVAVAGMSDVMSVQTEDDESIGLTVLGTCLNALAYTSHTSFDIEAVMVCVN